MRNNWRHGIIFIAIAAISATLPSCSKNQTESEAPVFQKQKQEMPAGKTPEELEQERLEHEAARRQLRAEKIKFMYEDIYFKKGRYSLDSEARAVLKRKAAWLMKNPDLKVIVEGHTDERGSKEYNFALGDLRAGAVKSFLIRQGIASPRLIAVSYGNERPSDSNKSEKGREKSRRVHFVIED
jgi:peptidoglycan-associated lipoprotein